MITRTGRRPLRHLSARGAARVRRRRPLGRRRSPGLPTPVTFCEIFPPDDFPLYFYRQPKAPDLEIQADELDFDAVREARVFWVTGTGLSEEPSRSATLAALAGTRQGRAPPSSTSTGAHVLDRPAGGRAPRCAEALRHTTVAVGNLDECEVATGVREPRAGAQALLDAGVELAVVKQGPKGVLAVTRTAPPRSRRVPVDVVNGLGAGDAFGGASCHGLLSGWDLEKTMRYANAAGAIVASRLACSVAMPTAGRGERRCSRRGGRADLEPHGNERPVEHGTPILRRPESHPEADRRGGRHAGPRAARCWATPAG